MHQVLSWIKSHLTGESGGGFALSPTFWETDGDAALLRKNQGFLTLESANEHCSLASSWKQLISFDEEEMPDWVESCDDEASQRIFELDAVRTFKSSECRRTLVGCLATVYQETADYHQGLGFIVSFLLLLLPPTSAVETAVLLHRHRLQGYFKSAPKAYVRDARALHKVIRQKLPHVADKLEELSIVPEMYMSKWFVGLNVHVLNYEQLIQFFDLVVRYGKTALFGFGLALIRVCEPHIMLRKTDTQVLLAILRLDDKEFVSTLDDDLREDLCERILLQTVTAIEEMDEETIEKATKEAEADLAEEADARKRREEEMEEYSDDIVFSDEE
ncbi:MAG: hypothetical protein KVP17_002283 [Porospora cf. gigantea B]|nr:MAG: hypothetical protein KVP17_002283 [Porospora cf. gigantea B]